MLHCSFTSEPKKKKDAVKSKMKITEIIAYMFRHSEHAEKSPENCAGKQRERNCGDLY